MTRIEKVQSEIKPFIEKAPISLTNAKKLLEYWEEAITPNTGFFKDENGSYRESIDRAEEFWGEKDLIRGSKLDVGLFPQQFYHLFSTLEMMNFLIEWKADRNAKFLFEDDKAKHKKKLESVIPNEHKLRYIEEELSKIENQFENLSAEETTSFVGGKFVKQLRLFNYCKPYLNKQKQRILQSKNTSLSDVPIKSISADNDWDFYYNSQNIGKPNFVRETEEYFQDGKRAGFFEPLAFMNLFWKQLQYLKKNFHKPYSTVRYFEKLSLTPEQRHVLYGFILKMYGGYPVQPAEVQMNITLILIVEAFLKFEGDTPEKEYCKSPDAFAFINNEYISLKPLPQSYKFSSTDFSGIAADYDWDYFLNIDNNRVQYSLILPLKKYFQEGKRAGYIEPLAFMNLFWMQYNRLLNCETKIRSFTDSLKELPISDEVRHILYGWLLKFHGGYPYQKQGLWYDNVFPVLEKEFLAYDGNTPEKRNFLRPDEYERMVIEAMGLPNVQTPNEKGVVVEKKPIVEPEIISEEVNDYSESIKDYFDVMESKGVRGWKYAFRSEEDYNMFVILLAKYFSDSDFELPTKTIQLKSKCKTKLAKVLYEVYLEFSSKSLKSNREFLSIVRVLSHYKDVYDDDLYKALTR